MTGWRRGCWGSTRRIRTGSSQSVCRIRGEDFMGIRALCSVAMLVAVSTAQAQVSEPTLHTSTRIVAVTIVATHSNGSPVNDLRASDIRVFDNKKEQTIASFEAMETSSTRDTTHKTVSAPTSLPVASGYPHFSIILLDALNTEWSDQMYAR